MGRPPPSLDNTCTSSCQCISHLVIFWDILGKWNWCSVLLSAWHTISLQTGWPEFPTPSNRDNSDCKIHPISSLMDSKAPRCNLRWLLTLQRDYLGFWLLLTSQKLAVNKTVTINPNCYTIGGRLKPPGNDLASSLSWSYCKGQILAELPTPQRCRGGISHKLLQNMTLGLHLKLNWKSWFDM